MEQTAAILVRKTPWSESSLIVAWLTERFGTLRTVARGARRPKSPFAGKLDLFYGAEISLSLSAKSDLHTLREVGLKTVFNVAGAGSAGFYLATYFCELAAIAAPAMHPAPEIFDLLQQGIAFVQRTSVTPKTLSSFEMALCRVLGVYDPAGKTSAIEALASLYGSIPASREMALRFFD